MIIKQVEASDLDELSKLFNGYRVFYKQDDDLLAVAEFLKTRFEQKDSVIFIAVDAQNKGMGFTQLFDSFTSVGMSKIWLLNDLFVYPSHRKKGIAKALMNKAKEHCIQTNRPKLVLETGHDNFNAQKLYKQLGYQKSKSLIYELNV